MNCKICNKINKKKISYFYKYLNKRYFKCFNCDFIFQYPLPNEKELKNIYSKEYFRTNYQSNNRNLKLRINQYKQDKKIILKYFGDNKSKKILDYGCGNGNFLKIFKSKKFGYEYNKDAVVSKQVIRLSEKESFKNKYNLIIMRGVIEHIADFDIVVKKLSKCLSKNGLFYITATPNTQNLTFFLSNKDFNQNHLGHIYHFNHVNLSLLFLQNNFLNIETIFQYSKTPYSNFVNDYKNLKFQIKNYKKNVKTFSPPAVGNMMTVVFKKMS
jgi:2-polyprenyl-3-methyl-5-hydroxy-6-metoxy-1,4-benzoquinol methylase